MAISVSETALTNAVATSPPIYAEGVNSWIIDVPASISSTSIAVYGSLDGYTFRRLRTATGSSVTIPLIGDSLVLYEPDVTSLAYVKFVTNADDSAKSWKVSWPTPPGQNPTKAVRVTSDPFGPGDPT